MKNIRVIHKKGTERGPNVLILAGVHGNEVCGVKAFEELIPKLEISKGEVTFIYANLEAQMQNKRFIEYDLNRCFLDNQSEEMKKTLEGKTARSLIPYLKKADVLLDLHSSNTSGNNPFIICEEDCLDLIDCLVPKKVVIGIDKAEKGGSDGYMFSINKPGICIECGLHEGDKSVEVAKKSIINFLKKMKIIRGNFEIYPEKELYSVKYVYKCKNGNFKLAECFRDFKVLKEKTLAGYDGEEEVYVDEGDYILFPHEAQEINQRCFLVLRSYLWRK